MGLKREREKKGRRAEKKYSGNLRNGVREIFKK